MVHLLFLQFGHGSGSKASFSPFVDPRVYQTSPTDDSDESSAAGKYINHKQTHLVITVGKEEHLWKAT